MTAPQKTRSRDDKHPVADAWATLGGFLAWGVKANAERLPDAPLAEHLAARRALAHEVASAALAVIDAIDRHPAS